VGQVDELLVRQAEDRAPEQRGQRQVVMRLQRETADGDEVLHGDVVGEQKPVGARHRNAAILQRPRQRMDETVALAHQHHDVARADGPALAFQHLTVADPAGDGAGDRLGKTCGRGRGMIDRLRPVVRLVDRDRAERRPQLDIARLVLADAFVLDVTIQLEHLGDHGTKLRLDEIADLTRLPSLTNRRPAATQQDVRVPENPLMPAERERSLVPAKIIQDQPRRLTKDVEGTGHYGGAGQTEAVVLALERAIVDAHVRIIRAVCEGRQPDQHTADCRGQCFERHDSPSMAARAISAGSPLRTS
jgi:hypothetical protein